ncbi:hypothetical protein [uncultured Sphingomonas sp.]|uniref:hypothetical protein n=1 Tax=uncultured Sphingomonas sp. TaxID=158754 RepID=UPI0026244CBB|nr:hypothetical protein [uncultured Sphingomonas sp.]
MAFAVLMAWAPTIARRFAAVDGWSASGLYGGVFSWASIQAGFLFAIYTFIVPKSEAFVRAVARTAAFNQFKRYMLRITWVTLLVALVAFALTVVNPKPTSGGYLTIFLAGWVSLSFYSFLGFIKVVRTFRKLDRNNSH